jgi:hypothetical protein
VYPKLPLFSNYLAAENSSLLIDWIFLSSKREFGGMKLIENGQFGLISVLSPIIDRKGCESPYGSQKLRS